MLDPKFADLIESLPASLEQLLAMTPVTVKSMPRPRQMPASGIYLWSEANSHIYVGRSRRIRQRLQEHVRPSSGHNQASFAFLIARQDTGMLDASYAPAGSRARLLEIPEFKKAFDAAKQRLTTLELRFVEESHPVRQCLLEVYAATVLNTRYNDFDSH